MKKFLKALIPAATIAFLAACGGSADEPVAPIAPPTGGGEVVTPVIPPDEVSGINIALIAHSPDSILDDGSFNEGAWQGIVQFSQANGLPEANRNFFQPHTASDDARIDLIYDAISWGADVLVLPGFHFESSLYEAQDMFPEATFILLDASPRGEDGVRIENNLVAIHYAEEQAGFLAGYAAVMDGYRNLGFMGGIAVPAVVRFGHGFIQGVDHAAESLGLAQGEVTIRYTYLGRFAPGPEVQTQAAAWFASDVEVIFSAAGGAGFSVFEAADAANASTIGVDVDQANDSPTVITSAMKGLAPSVYQMLTAFANGNFPGGQQLIFDASIDGVSIAMSTSRFGSFTQAQYDAIFAQLANGSVNVNNSLEMDDISTNLVVVEEV